MAWSNSTQERNDTGFGGSYAFAASDTVDFGGGLVSRALCVGTAGTIKVTMADDSVVTLVLLQGVHPIRCRRIWASPAPPANLVVLT